MTAQWLTIISGLVLLAVILAVAWHIRKHRHDDS